MPRFPRLRYPVGVEEERWRARKWAGRLASEDRPGQVRIDFSLFRAIQTHEPGLIPVAPAPKTKVEPFRPQPAFSRAEILHRMQDARGSARKRAFQSARVEEPIAARNARRQQELDETAAMLVDLRDGRWVGWYTFPTEAPDGYPVDERGNPR